MSDPGDVFLATFVACSDCGVVVLTKVDTDVEGNFYVDPVSCDDHQTREGTT